MTKAAVKPVKTCSVSKVREHLAEVLGWVKQGEEVVITKHGKAIVTITRPARAKPGFREAEGWKFELGDDFNCILEDFEEDTSARPSAL
jgi:prevent-host-death family protein